MKNTTTMLLRKNIIIIYYTVLGLGDGYGRKYTSSEYFKGGGYYPGPSDKNEYTPTKILFLFLSIIIILFINIFIRLNFTH